MIWPGWTVAHQIQLPIRQSQICPSVSLKFPQGNPPLYIIRQCNIQTHSLRPDATPSISQPFTTSRHPGGQQQRGPSVSQPGSPSGGCLSSTLSDQQPQPVPGGHNLVRSSVPHSIRKWHHPFLNPPSPCWSMGYVVNQMIIQFSKWLFCLPACQPSCELVGRNGQ